MKLNEKEEQILINFGYSLEDIKQIKLMKYKFYLYENNVNRKISQKEAKQILSLKDFLSGIGRASFHRISMRKNSDMKVLIESNLFE